MATASLGFATPPEYRSGNMFACGNNTAKGSNSFLSTFGNTATNTRSVDPSQVEQRSRPGSGLGLITKNTSIFDLGARSSAGSPYQSQFSVPDASGMPGWGNEMIHHPLSPPDSGSYSPKNWSFNLQQNTPSNILTDAQILNTREHYGQVTPPDDQNDSESLLEYQLREQLHRVDQQDENTSSSKKRKRNSPSNVDASTQPPKRTRKYASRGSNSSDLIDPTKPEDVRRSKFLERNRVAASKCRQKKKEWTQNLESRARELQKNNASLRLMLESLRQELLFLKGEMLQHNQCGCIQIQEFLKTGANTAQDFSEQDLVFKREDSPLESMSPSRLQSSDEDDESKQSSSPALPAVSDVTDDNVIEALLTSSINHDTSDEGIASQLHR